MTGRRIEFALIVVALLGVSAQLFAGSVSKQNEGRKASSTELTIGSKFTVNASDVAGGLIGNSFYATPKVYGTDFTIPYLGKPGNAPAAVLTKIKNGTVVSGGDSAESVDCEWKKKICLYDKTLTKANTKQGKTMDEALVQTESLEIPLKVDVKVSQKILFKDADAGTLELVPPSITRVTYSGELSAGTELTIVGSFFGNKAPIVTIEYTNEKNGNTTVKYKRCKVLKSSYAYSDAKGKANKSVMDVATGDSQLKVLYPSLKADKDTATGLIVIDNKIGIAYHNLNTYNIYGTVSGDVQEGVVLTLTGAAVSGAYVSRSDGGYTFSELDPGSYTITPTLDGYTFSPTSISVTLTNSSSEGNNFTATKNNTKPSADSQDVTVDKNTAKAITLHGTDLDGEALTYTVLTNPSHGTLSGSGRDQTYTPTTDYTGTDSFTFKVNDGKEDSDPATISITVKGAGGGGTGEYFIVDLTTWTTSASTTVPADLLTNTDYKSNKIVLRKISAGTYNMGKYLGEVGGFDNETQHSVTLTKDFYISVFEITQAQYTAVMGSNPSTNKGDSRPVETVSWDTVRGGTWPSGEPSSSSFMGVLGLRADKSFDLPTEAQWEYACRAGTTNSYNNDTPCLTIVADSEDTNLNPLAWYYYNASRESKQHQDVGTKQANNWGLYDMHGNVMEWCLDWYQTDLGSSAVTDPTGATTGTTRVYRGGGWSSYNYNCRSARRYEATPESSDQFTGFRLYLPAQ